MDYDILFNKPLDMKQMYEDAFLRGKDNTVGVYYRVNGSIEEYSYNDLALEAKNLVKKMQAAGLKKHDRIAVVSSLRPWWFALNYACLLGEYIMVCIDPGVPALQMQNMMLQTEVRAVFTTLPIIHLPNELDKHIPVFSISTGFPMMSKCEKVDSILLGECKDFPKDTFYVLFSSGTTSENRKAVLLKHSTVTKGIEYGMSKDAGIYKNTSAYTPRQRDLMLFPPYHIAGLLCATYDFYCETKIIMLERLTPNALVNALQTLKPDNICTVPSMLTSLYKKIVAGYSSNIFTKTSVDVLASISGHLRKRYGIKAGRVLLKPLNKKAFGGEMKGFMIGASPIDYKTNKFFLDMGIDVSMAYGLTELGAPLATTGQGYYPGCGGRVIKHNNDLDIRIVNQDETGRGEVEVLSPYRMISYLDEKDNEGCFTADGYFKTGDLGYFDKNKCLNICGRIKESIVLKNGEKLLPEEIEDKYQGMDCVAEVAVFKVPGDGGCDAFSIALVKQKEKGIPDEAMKTRVYERAEHLPSMYKPKDVYVISKLPLSSSHKVQRFRLTQMALEGNSNPITDSSMIPVDEDETTAKLREILTEVGGSEWKTKKLTQGLMLNIDSLATVDLYVKIQEEWKIDLFQTNEQPETFGELLDVINNFDAIDKNNKEKLDLSKYPLPISPIGKLAVGSLEKVVKTVYKVRKAGLDNIPKDTNYIICANHRTALDPSFITICLPRKQAKKTCIVGKAELVSDKLLKGFVLSHNIIPVDRTGNTIQTLDRCRELLFEGYNVLIFPEGTNVENHTKLYPLKDGAAKLAIATNKPIVPCNISGIAHVKKEMDNFTLPPFKSRVRIKFGKPIYPKDMSVKELNDLLKDKIEELG